MRDIALTLIVGYLLIRTLGKPVIGAYLWAWLSLMNPHRMTWGFAYGLPFALTAALFTLVGMLFSKERKPLPINGGVVLLLLLWGWMTLTSFMSINPPDLVWARWVFVSKIYLMLLVTLMLIRGRKQIDTLVWVLVVSIGFFAVKGGAFTILTAGNFRVWGPPGSMVEGNNPLAVATLIVMPLAYYLHHTLAKPWARAAMMVAIVLMGASVLGSQSRGALVALLAMAFVLGLKSKHPFRFSLALAVLLGVGISFMPESWTTRMETIEQYNQDTSALSRLYTWHTLWNVAVDRPLLGAGFRADVLSVFERYAPSSPEYAIFDGLRWVAHSIYFEALGEHGFVGLALFVSMYLWVWFAGARLARRAAQMADLRDWMPVLLRMCQVSVVAYGAGGAFLSLMSFDLPLYLIALVTLCKCEIDERQRTAGPAAA